MQAFGFVILLAIGLIQFAATMAGLTSWLGLRWLPAALVSIFLGWTPLVGSLLGFLGAFKVWGWEWWQAALLFFGLPLITIYYLGGFAGVADWLSERRAAKHADNYTKKEGL